MKAYKIIVVILTAVMIIAGSAMAQSKSGDVSDKELTFYVNDPAGRNIVAFKSSAPLEDIVGVSSDITGSLTFNPANPEKGGQARFTIPVKTFDTGIPTRNEHMQSEGWLDAEKYPNIILTVDNISEIRKFKESKSAVTYEINANASISLHGVTKAITVPARITYMAESEATQKRLPGDILAVRADFIITLADFGITGPKEMAIIGSKVGETINIEVSIMGSTKSDAPAKM